MSQGGLRKGRVHLCCRKVPTRELRLLDEEEPTPGLEAARPLGPRDPLGPHTHQRPAAPLLGLPTPRRPRPGQGPERPGPAAEAGRRAGPPGGACKARARGSRAEAQEASAAHLDQVVDVDLAVPVLIQGRGQADELALGNVPDLLHGADELGDADDRLPGDTAARGWLAAPPASRPPRPLPPRAPLPLPLATPGRLGHRNSRHHSIRGPPSKAGLANGDKDRAPPLLHGVLGPVCTHRAQQVDPRGDTDLALGEGLKRGQQRPCSQPAQPWTPGLKMRGPGSHQC